MWELQDGDYLKRKKLDALKLDGEKMLFDVKGMWAVTVRSMTVFSLSEAWEPVISAVSQRNSDGHCPFTTGIWSPILILTVTANKVFWSYICV